MGLGGVALVLRAVSAAEHRYGDATEVEAGDPLLRLARDLRGRGGDQLEAGLRVIDDAVGPVVERLQPGLLGSKLESFEQAASILLTAVGDGRRDFRTQASCSWPML